MDHPELRSSPKWGRTGDPFFPVAARVGGVWWVLRINSFPDHPLHTLFVDGQVRFDIDDTPLVWGNPAGPAVLLEPVEVVEALAPLDGLVAYGSERGEPCENPYCCG